jgi:uncharacterized protein (DUF2252 family)
MPIDVVSTVQAFNAGRDPQRLTLKYQKMRASPFAFLRGTCHLFYDRLAQTSDLEKSPSVWVCGDMHLENFGSYKGDNRLVYFDLNDFDESALAPACWELVRMLSSIELGGAEMGLTPKEARAVRKDFLNAYVAELAVGKSHWLERDNAVGPVHLLLSSLRARTRIAFLDSRTERRPKQRVIRIDGKRALAASPAERTAVGDLMAAFARSQPNPDFFQVLDVARRIGGTGSLGLERYTVLVKGKAKNKREIDGNYLLDIKRAGPSALLPHLTIKQPDWPSEAHRVVAVQQRMQAVPMAFLHAVHWGQRSVVLRALQPSEDRIVIAPTSHASADFRQVLVNMGQLLAWAQLRSAGRQGSVNADTLIDFAHAPRWQTRLLDSARACTQQVLKDADLFNAAFDDGDFAVDSHD